MPNNLDDIADKLSNEISYDVGNNMEDELSNISTTFNNILNDALKKFNSSTFDNDGFIKKFSNLATEKKDMDVMKNVLNTLKNDYIDVSNLNQSELLLRRDMSNICTQMPEMRDTIYVIRDSIIECNVSTGEVSRSLIFSDCNTETELLESKVKELEEKFNLSMAIKNFVVPNTLKCGEMYIHVIPYSKIFAELEYIKNNKTLNNGNKRYNENVNSRIDDNYNKNSNSLLSMIDKKDLSILMESVDPITKTDSVDIYRIGNNNSVKPSNIDNISKSDIELLLNNINVCTSTSVLLEELGEEGLKNIIINECKNQESSNKETHFSEAMIGNRIGSSMFNNIDADNIDIKNYSHIKGCYVKYLDSLRVAPIRMDRKVIGYYYATTTTDLTLNPSQPKGIVDLSFQNFTRDKNLVDNLASIIIKSFDKQMLEKNIKLKNEIVEVIMAHKFSEGQLTFIYIPESEVVRLVINEDENGKGHGVLEPSLFPSRMYLMLNLYNMLYILNNNTTRIHYLRSSGMNKNYSSQIQRTMRKYQSRRITVDDIYSYQGVLNKVGGMGEMVLPAGRGDYKALETDTIEAVNNPINIEFLEQQRRQAISGTGSPHLLVINALDEVDFAKTLEMANARFLSTVSSYKIDFNRGITEFYKLLMKYSTDFEDDVINSFKFKFNAIKQQELNITADMITNFNSLVEVVASLYYSKSQIEDDKGNPTSLLMNLRRELAKKYLPQLNFDELEEVVKKINLTSKDDILQQRVAKINIGDEDLEELEK